MKHSVRTTMSSPTPTLIERAPLGKHKPAALICLTTAIVALAGLVSANQNPTSDIDLVRQRALRREKALGIERVYLGEHEYHFRLPRGLNTPETRDENGLIWIYDGQQLHSEGFNPPMARLVKLEPEEHRTEVEGILGTVKVDRYGRRWMVIGVEDVGLRQAVGEYDALVERKFGLEPDTAPYDPIFAATDEDEEDLGWVQWIPHTWFERDCDFDNTEDIARWGKDDRVQASNPMSTPQRKVVLIATAQGWGSGVMVDSNTVLTAAHVVSDSSGSPVPVIDIEVKTLGNYQVGAAVLGATAVTLAPGYTGDGDLNDDYALIHLTGSAGVGWMAISQAGNSTIKNATAHIAGYPGFGPNCTSTSEKPIDKGTSASTQYEGTGELYRTTRRRVMTRVDSGPGHSGGPLFYYPNGCCGAHFVTGVVSAFTKVTPGKDYLGGPKGRAIRNWVIANM